MRRKKRICKKLEHIMEIRFYGMRSGPDVRSSKILQKEFKDTIPEQINILYIDREKDEISLLSSPQRDLFFEKVMESTSDKDTVDLVEEVFAEIE